MVDVFLILFFIVMLVVSIISFSDKFYIRSIITIIFGILSLVWFIFAHNNYGKVIKVTRCTIQNVTEDKTELVKQCIIFEGKIVDISTQFNGTLTCKQIDIIEHSRWTYYVYKLFSTDSNKSLTSNYEFKIIGKE